MVWPVGSEPNDTRKNCQISVEVGVPHGFTYALAKADYRGYASLHAGAYGVNRVSYYFQGMSGTATVSRTFNGPWHDTWRATTQFSATDMLFRPCGELRNLDINSELIVNAGTSDPRTTTSLMTMDSDFGTTIYLSWKRC